MRLTQPPLDTVAALFASIRSQEGLPDRHQDDLKHADDRRFFIASSADDTNPEAYVQLILRNADNDPELADGAKIAHVHDLRVVANKRRQGIASKTMQALESYAQTQGVEMLTLGVDSTNEAAKQLYKKLGYEEFKSAEGRAPDERCLYMRKSIRPYNRLGHVVEFLLVNFGPLIVFYVVQKGWGLKGAVIASVIFSIAEFTYLKLKHKTVTLFFYFSFAMTMIFGAVDLYLVTPIFFKFEAGITNLITAFFFGATIFKGKPLLQEFAEQKRSFEDRDPRDTRFYFQFMTTIWTLYFVAKAIAYTHINLNTSLDEALIIRMVLGNVSFYALLAVSILGGRAIWIALRNMGLMPSTRKP